MKEIQLTQGHIALVDDEDCEYLLEYMWCVKPGRHTFYAVHNLSITEVKSRKLIFMHREIMKPSDGVFVDHIDGNGLNNQKSNLRFCNRSQNMQNSTSTKNNISGFKGVTKSANNKWIARIWINGEKHHVGVFNTPEEAAIAYDNVAKLYYGEFANLNFGNIK